MKVTLQREENIQVFDAIATLVVFESNREDLHSIMREIRKYGVNYDILRDLLEIENSDYIVKGIIQYLKQNGLLDEQNTITKSGEIFLQDKQYPNLERGKFKFWFIDDSLFGAQLIHFERVRESKEVRNLVEFEKGLSLERKSFQGVLRQELGEFTLLNFDRQPNSTIKIAHYPDLRTVYSIEWDIDTKRDQPSLVTLTGEIRSRRGNEKSFSRKNISINNDIDIKDILIKIIKDNKEQLHWNHEVEAFEFPIDKDTHESDLLSFTTLIGITKVDTHFGSFNQSVISDVPIMPANRDDAKVWFEKVISDTASKNFINLDEFNAMLKETISRKEFKYYTSSLQALAHDDFVSQFKKERKEREFWHLQATVDLHPPKGNEFIINSKHVGVGEQYSMKEIVKMLIGSEKPEKLVFSSKYLSNFYQIKKFSLFAEAFSYYGVEDISVVTTDYIDLGNSNISLDLFYNVYGEDRKTWPHDRYFAFKTSGKWIYFKMTAELDQCTYDQNIKADELSIDTQGKWRDISFIQLEKDIFPLELKEYADKKEGVTSAN
ncbi:hypothetical protein ACFSO7_01150 [Bacillus sp. CGMCC 1.16607]|uniref:hypothetical protein n=1 Tax=Bacillus sp. CGMCC 1.16607 TaxID=3351842 RepID=UPI00363C350A